MVEFSASEKESLFRVRFFYPGVPGHIVALAGVFNDWDPAHNPMTYCRENQNYSCFLELPAGVYEYKLVADGQWMIDEGNPNFVSNDFGTLNSIVTVK
jgi:hypothetical protein